MSLQNRIDHLLVSQASKEKSNSRQLKLFGNLTKDAIVQELHEQNVKFTCSSSAKDVNALLENEVHGIQRVPALMYNNAFDTLESLNLSKYEILFTEPLHDVSNHIKNLYQEISYHVPKDKKKDVRQILDISFHGKDAKNSSDYRKSLLIVAKWFCDNLPEHFLNKILLLMCNIQAITYYSEKKRSLQSILRLYSTTFQHALTIKTSLLGNIKGSTAHKFIGSYYHSIVKHSPFRHRQLSSNTEKEESTFNSMKMFTNLGSNHHSENIIVNALVRIQAKEKLNEGKAESNNKDTIFNNLYEPIEKLQANTIISLYVLVMPCTRFRVNPHSIVS